MTIVVSEYRDNTMVYEYDNPLELEELQPEGKNALSRNHMHGSSIKWHGVEGGVPRVLEIRERGWPDGYKRAQETIGEIAELPQLMDFRRKRRFADHGDQIHMDRVMAGRLDIAWESRKREASAGMGMGVTRIMVGIGATASYSAEQMYWRGAVACLLADALEMSGRPVEIIAYSHVAGSYPRYKHKNRCDIITLKQADQMLDIDTIAACTAMAGYFRHFVFKARLSDPKRLCADNMGTTINMPPEGYYDRDNDIVIDNVWTQHEAELFIKRELEKYKKESA